LLYKTDRLKSKIKILLERLLKECRDSTSLPQIFVHGDFAPWNIKKINNGSLMALDWEMGDPNGLPFYDFFYFFIIQAYLFKDKFNLNRIFKLLPGYSKNYPLLQILKFTAVSLGLRLAKGEQNTEYLEKFLRSIN
jgi:Ser/Thr protein kinase RdoA (MazF antagonist)